MNITPEIVLNETKKIYTIAQIEEGMIEAIGPFDNISEQTSQRTAAMQLELCESIETLLNNGKIRSAYTLLRSSLEIASSFSWMCLDYKNRIRIYNSGKTPSIQKMMHKLGWKDEYDKVYRQLSEFVHGDFRLSSIERYISDVKAVEESKTFIMPTLFIEEENNNIQKLYISNNKTDKELYEEHSYWIYLKLFDIAVSMYIYASGEYSDSHKWFPKKKFLDEVNTIINLFKKIDSDSHFLWPITKRNLIVYKKENWFKDTIY